MPEGVRFALLPGGEAAFAGRSALPYGDAEGSELPPDMPGQQLPPLDETEGVAGWSWPVYFYPDGTADSASICLENEQGRRIEVRLRGLTGVVTIGSNIAAEEALP